MSSAGRSKLAPKQERFVQEYLVDLNATQSTIRAGYSPKTANAQAGRLLVNVSVRQGIQKAFAKRAERTGITQDWIIRCLRENVERAMQNVPVLDRKGDPTGKYEYNGTVANRALELLGMCRPSAIMGHVRGVENPRV